MLFSVFSSADRANGRLSESAVRPHRFERGRHLIERFVDVGGGVGEVDVHHAVDDDAALEDLALEAEEEVAVAGGVGRLETDLAAGREAADRGGDLELAEEL